MVPYSKEHVPIVHGWMQQQEFYTGFGVQPPSLEQVRAWPPPVVLLERVSALLSCGNWAINWLRERESTVRAPSLLTNATPALCLVLLSGVGAHRTGHDGKGHQGLSRFCGVQQDGHR